MTLEEKDKWNPHQTDAVLGVQAGEQMGLLDIKHTIKTQTTENGNGTVNKKPLKEVEALIQVTPCPPSSLIIKGALRDHSASR